MIRDIRKQKITNQNNKKKNDSKKNKDSISSVWDNFKHPNICIIGVLEGEEKEQEIRNLFEKINEIKLPSFGEGNRHASPGSTENPKQDGCKEAHFKIHYN